jgi:ATP-dependent Clp protease ATP-binding subunit ClpX
VHEFANRFQETHGLALKFTEAAAERLVTMAYADKSSVRDYCSRKFKDFQFGLRLIAQNTAQSEFILDEAAIESPDKVLSEWVVASYRSEGKKV